MRLFLATVPPLLGLLLWRSGYTLYYNILTKLDLPEGYYNQGDHSTHCSPLNSEVSDPGFKFCEDASFWELHDSDGKLEERRAIVSCDSGRKSWNTVMGPLAHPEPHGSLWFYSPKPGQKPTRFTFENYPKGHDFHPLGVETYPSYAGNSSYLYVVNHARKQTFIEQFLVSPSSSVATHVRTLSHQFFIAPNALALTSPTSFYVTNDHVFTRRLPSYFGKVLPLVETMLGIPLSFTAHVTLDPDVASKNPILSHSVVAPFVAFSNGVSVSPSGLEVAIASTTVGKIYFYNRNISTNALTYTTSVQVPITPDNIKYDGDGNLVVAGHPHFPTLVEVVGNKTSVAPSWVVSISPRSGVEDVAPLSAHSVVPPSANHTLQTLFQSDGSAFSSSSTGIRDSLSGNLYISGLYAEEGVFVCRP